MRYLLSFCGLMLFLPLNSHSPKGRLYDHFDLGLPDGNEIVIGFIIAFVAIPIGYLISRNTKDASSKGCFGTLLIGVGIIALLPLFAWLCSILNFIISIGLVIFIGIIIVTLVYYFLKRK